MLVLTVNPGSSSLRAHLVDTTDERVVDELETGQPADSEEALRALGELLDRLPAEPISLIAHRVVHAGKITEPAVVDETVREALRSAAPLAPAHVPKTLALLDFLHDRLPDRVQLICPDTAFHRDLPEAAYTYPVPASWREWGVRRYGFHGLSYGWALRRAAELLDRPAGELQVLIAHLSGGCSACAVRDGRSADTSMGFTPLEGMAMSTRSGSVDPGLLFWLLEERGLEPGEVSEQLQHASGLLGLSGGLSADTRDLVADGSPAARLALDVFCHRVRRELGALATSLERLDAVVFTGDIGWDQPEVTEAVCAGLGTLGVHSGLDSRREEDAVISSSGVPVLTVRSREELQLAAVAARQGVSDREGTPV
ncbi:acetate/propionate family kinase [Amycolatopsis suaedae]|uniref:acetate/propionate family kinase n=1 Tax=Amycolatopsis suaedae TaxID=2510978 RepID=UPI001F0D7BD7|nr:acetate kinase [Amycolatopsis suaedae]